MPIPTDLIEAPQVQGAPPTAAERKAAAADAKAMDSLFDENTVEDPAPEPEPKPEPKPKLVPANPPKPAPVAKEPEPAPVVRPPRVLPAIPPQEEEEDVIDVEDDPEVKEVEAEPEPEPKEGEPSAAVKQLADALKIAFPQKVEDPKADPLPELSDADRDRLLNVYTPADDLYDRMSNPETRVEAMKELVGGLRTESRTWAVQVAQQIVQSTLAQREQQQQQQQTTQQTLASYRENFFKTYPVLQEDRYLPTVKAVTALLKEEGFVPKDFAELSKTLAERTEAVLKGADPTFKLTSQTTKSTTKIPSPTVLKGKGGGGDSGLKTSKATVQKAAGTEVFD